MEVVKVKRDEKTFTNNNEFYPKESKKLKGQ